MYGMARGRRCRDTLIPGYLIRVHHRTSASFAGAPEGALTSRMSLALWRTSHSMNMSALAPAPRNRGAKLDLSLNQRAQGVRSGLGQQYLGGRRRWLTLDRNQWTDLRGCCLEARWTGHQKRHSQFRHHTDRDARDGRIDPRTTQGAKAQREPAFVGLLCGLISLASSRLGLAAALGCHLAT
jgi:hypothetical protein